MRTKIHSALFVDFDNLFISLRHDYGDDTAEKFATHPGRWLDWLSRFDTPELADDGPEYRRILLRKCYLNPNGGYKANKDDKDGKGRWIGYGRYRVDFARAAFEVVDCPSLTRQRKSSTDITMALSSAKWSAGTAINSYPSKKRYGTASAPSAIRYRANTSVGSCTASCPRVATSAATRR